MTDIIYMYEGQEYLHINSHFPIPVIKGDKIELRVVGCKNICDSFIVDHCEWSQIKTFPHPGTVVDVRVTTVQIIFLTEPKK